MKFLSRAEVETERSWGWFFKTKQEKCNAMDKGNLSGRVLLDDSVISQSICWVVKDFHDLEISCSFQESSSFMIQSFEGR